MNIRLDAYRLEVGMRITGGSTRMTGWQTRRVRAKGKRRAGVVDVYAMPSWPVSVVGEVQLEDDARDRAVGSGRVALQWA